MNLRVSSARRGRNQLSGCQLAVHIKGALSHRIPATYSWKAIVGGNDVYRAWACCRDLPVRALRCWPQILFFLPSFTLDGKYRSTGKQCQDDMIAHAARLEEDPLLWSFRLVSLVDTWSTVWTEHVSWSDWSSASGTGVCFHGGLSDSGLCPTSMY